MVLISAARTMTALATWERVVAMATPATPSFRTTTKNMSRIILIKQEIIRKYRGRLASPAARRIPDPMLYIKEGMTPRKYIRI